ncbi:hypothetical protein SCHPADRAFT_940249 [Schizopora paradoxa]|uniref:ABM domain-containing protein n=1 Tax=Schizopora paradoxa TaxID=27342 RepID=A0A0H2S9P4_9AGAM|nr:hypothetical protein SCHPADRAFT_940249 [Schizopora paradoxa]
MSPDHNVDDVTELVFFDGYDSNDAAAATLAKVKTLDGCLRVYSGSDLSNDGSAIWFQEWKSYEHHAAFQRSEIYPSFIAGVPAFAKSVAKMAHVCLRPYPADSILRSPITELIILLRNSDSSAQQLEDGFKDLEGALASWQDAVAHAKGVCLEDDREHVFICGWKSKEGQETFRAKYSKIFEALQKFGDVKTKLYSLEC